MIELIRPYIDTAIRTSLETAADDLVAHGVLLAEQKPNFVGASMFLIGVAWAGAEKYLLQQAQIQKSLQPPAPPPQ